MHYYAAYVPVMKEIAVFCGEESQELDALGLLSLMRPNDELWLMMGSTNADVALGAFRRGVILHQLSYARAKSALSVLSSGNGGERIKISAQDVRELALARSEVFYSMHARQGEVLEIMTAWDEVDQAMEARKAYANRLRASMRKDAVVSGQQISTDELKDKIEKALETDQGLQYFTSVETRAENRLAKVMRGSAFYSAIFGDIKGVGPKIAARFVSAIERIERFAAPKDLSNYAGMLPRGQSGKLPSRRLASQGRELLSRSPALNTACFNVQEWMLKYGKNTQLGAVLHDKIRELCPCTAEERGQDKELRKRHVAVVRQARIEMTRVFLEQFVHPRWTAYVGASRV